MSVVLFFLGLALWFIVGCAVVAWSNIALDVPCHWSDVLLVLAWPAVGATTLLYLAAHRMESPVVLFYRLMGGKRNPR